VLTLFTSRPPLPFSDQQPDRHRDPEVGRHGPAVGGAGEVGGSGGHLPLPPQLQRCPGDHVIPEPQLRVPPQEDLAQGLQAGHMLILLLILLLLVSSRSPITINTSISTPTITITLNVTIKQVS